ncbi:MAG: hypothetical protein ACREAX_00570 [Candidatus Nitrosotenuis sp.]
MAGKILGLLTMSILLSAVLVIALSDNAEAKTSKESPKHKFSKWSKKVCGDQLCKEGTHLKTIKTIGRSSPNNN